MRQFKILIVPSGSAWTCWNCSLALDAGSKVARRGKQRYCASCVQTGNKQLSRREAATLRQQFDRGGNGV